MISKKRYWGLALPIYDCAACGSVRRRQRRDDLRARAVEGWEQLEGHTSHRPTSTPSGSPAARAERRSRGSRTLEIPGSMPASCRSRRSTTGRTRATGRVVPGRLRDRELPGQFRNWFYSMLAMSTVLRRSALPDDLRLRHALRRGRPADAQELGNAIEFDEAAERMGVDVMRWMYAKARPDDNIRSAGMRRTRRGASCSCCGTSTLLRDVRAAGRLSRASRRSPHRRRRRSLAGRRWTAGSCRGWPAWPRAWRIAWGTTTGFRASSISGFIDELSTWYLRRTGSASRARTIGRRAAAFATLHWP